MEEYRKYLANFFFVAGLGTMSGPATAIFSVFEDFATTGHSSWMTWSGWLMNLVIFLVGLSVVILGSAIVFEAKPEGGQL